MSLFVQNFALSIIFSFWVDFDKLFCWIFLTIFFWPICWRFILTKFFWWIFWSFILTIFWQIIWQIFLTDFLSNFLIIYFDVILDKFFDNCFDKFLTNYLMNFDFSVDFLTYNLLTIALQAWESEYLQSCLLFKECGQ